MLYYLNRKHLKRGGRRKRRKKRNGIRWRKGQNACPWSPSITTNEKYDIKLSHENGEEREGEEVGRERGGG